MVDSSTSGFTLAQISALIDGQIENPPAGNPVFSRVVCDSRQVEAGVLFVALTGSARDGHEFVDQAFSQGAAAAVVTQPEYLKDRPGIVVTDTRSALSALAAAMSGAASSRLINVGITGTNGKTSINWIVYHALQMLDCQALRVGTLGVEAGKLFSREGSLTTPDAVELHETFKRCADAGITHCVMEVSSHALEQCRADDIRYDVGVFTNLTRDHLDYHGDMESYFLAKFKLFALLSQCQGLRTAVINVDSEHGKRIIETLPDLGLRNLSFGRDPQAAVRFSDFTQDLQGSSFVIHFEGKALDVRARMIGLHNAYNLCAAFAVMIALGFPAERVIQALAGIPQVPGRLEMVGGAPFGVYVDFAHSPDALQNVLLTLRDLVKNELWVVFGCGGDRDRTKRPMMGNIAARLADRVVVTSDNPRTEDPNAIIQEIVSDWLRPDILEPDRRKAIRRALTEAKAGDVVLIAGKGHENYQIIGTVKSHMSDVEEAAKVLQELSYQEAH